MFQEDINEVQEVLNKYFEGVFYGNIEKLKAAFHPEALLFGDVNGQPYYKNLEEYIEGVKNRESPHTLKEKFEMEVIGAEIVGNIALVKAHLPMLGFNYYDYLSLSKINGSWIIVNKLFTNIS